MPGRGVGRAPRILSASQSGHMPTLPASGDCLPLTRRSATLRALVPLQMVVFRSVLVPLKAAVL